MLRYVMTIFIGVGVAAGDQAHVPAGMLVMHLCTVYYIPYLVRHGDALETICAPIFEASDHMSCTKLSLPATSQPVCSACKCDI
jgi:hypothetical protein